MFYSIRAANIGATIIFIVVASTS